MAELRQEKFDLLIAELSKLRAEDIVNSNMVGIPPKTYTSVRTAPLLAAEVGDAHARYATVREGSLLKCSDSMNRSSRFQLMKAVSSVRYGERTAKGHILRVPIWREGSQRDTWPWSGREVMLWCRQGMRKHRKRRNQIFGSRSETALI